MSNNVEFSQTVGDLPDRVVAANDASLFENGSYVLVILNRALRGEDNAVIDAALCHADVLNLPVVAYSELAEQVAWASERLFYFALGAFRECAIALQKRNIQCVQTIEKKSDDTLTDIASQAAVIYTDEDYTHWDRVRLTRLLARASQSVFLVDASRLVPTRQLPKGLKTTPAFRKAHGALRDRYAALRKEVPTLQSKQVKLDLPIKHNFADYSDADLSRRVSECDINKRVAIAKEHPPTQAEIDNRIEILQEKILARYKWIRNNAALEYSTSRLSPYMHFGMLSPHQLLAAIEASDVPKTYTWKFRDEFLTWREWSHYQAYYVPNLHEYATLPKKAKQTLEDHADDSRPELLSDEDIFDGRSPDATWNAAQREWMATGWLHNNLRMYWSKQILRFTESPEAAWKMACYINDYISLDGRDPATYASMQWAFGNAKPGYSEKPIYGWVAPKSDSAILKRKGMAEWIEARNLEGGSL